MVFKAEIFAYKYFFVAVNVPEDPCSVCNAQLTIALPWLAFLNFLRRELNWLVNC